ncbi:MAG: hypothetical protein RL299_874 [Pseudomonadota bacterium]
MAELRIALPQPFPPGARALGFADGFQVLVFNIAGTLHAIENNCPHAGGSLAGGKLEGQLLRCPSHGLKVDVTCGAIAGGGELQLRTFPVRLEGACALVELG